MKFHKFQKIYSIKPQKMGAKASPLYPPAAVYLVARCRPMLRRSQWSKNWLVYKVTKYLVSELGTYTTYT